jgi:hypothetical protein
MTVTVASGSTTQVAFKVTCVANAILQIAVVTTGSNLPVGHYQVIAEGFDHSYSNQIPPNGTIGLVVPPGGYGVRLVDRDLTQNCTIGQNPRYVSVASGSTTRVAFSVTCVATGTLRVTVATTGPNAPATYMLGVDPDPDMPFRYAVSVSSNGTTVSSTLPVGEHVATLVVLTPCFVTSSNPVSVTLTSGTTNLGFTVACRP